MKIDNQYIAYSDESNHTDGRYGSISIVSLKRSNAEKINTELLSLLQESNVTEFKWSNTKSAREKFAAIKMIDFALKHTVNKNMRIDNLIWDLEDSRHKVKKRDQQENFRRIYYHALKNVFNKRWGTSLEWLLMPDENSAVDWSNVRTILNYSSEEKQMLNFDSEEYEIITLKQFNINSIEESTSSDIPLIQMADLFAGISAYSYLNFDKYNQFKNYNSGQYSLPIFNDINFIKLSSNDKSRCEILRYLHCECKKNNLQISLESTKGLKARNPKKTWLNFWLYEPQSIHDKAPIKKKHKVK